MVPLQEKPIVTDVPAVKADSSCAGLEQSVMVTVVPDPASAPGAGADSAEPAAIKAAAVHDTAIAMPRRTGTLSFHIT